MLTPPTPTPLTLILSILFVVTCNLNAHFGECFTKDLFEIYSFQKLELHIYTYIITYIINDNEILINRDINTSVLHVTRCKLFL